MLQGKVRGSGFADELLERLVRSLAPPRTSTRVIREVLELFYRTMWDDQFDLSAKCDFENNYDLFSHISR